MHDRRMFQYLRSSSIFGRRTNLWLSYYMYINNEGFFVVICCGFTKCKFMFRILHTFVKLTFHYIRYSPCKNRIRCNLKRSIQNKIRRPFRSAPWHVHVYPLRCPFRSLGKKCSSSLVLVLHPEVDLMAEVSSAAWTGSRKVPA